ncbi:MAG: hypothetical protein Faunusvirus5_19 [Faunusvirus sp.]|jgi:hypothetical protein|uniref:Uncharacterized protein n=1 Tax=Faunusvirus sp. TaxID=2487766 RepID=A0A3G4ZWI0_9VIRU|nr:MAG: hypothetical protein Faunusvirus5_19 [Faunusvirus sp.]
MSEIKRVVASGKKPVVEKKRVVEKQIIVKKHEIDDTESEYDSDEGDESDDSDEGDESDDSDEGDESEVDDSDALDEYIDEDAELAAQIELIEQYEKKFDADYKPKLSKRQDEKKGEVKPQEIFIKKISLGFNPDRKIINFSDGVKPVRRSTRTKKPVDYTEVDSDADEDENDRIDPERQAALEEHIEAIPDTFNGTQVVYLVAMYIRELDDVVFKVGYTQNLKTNENGSIKNGRIYGLNSEFHCCEKLRVIAVVKVAKMRKEYDVLKQLDEYNVKVAINGKNKREVFEPVRPVYDMFAALKGHKHIMPFSDIEV